MDSIVFEESVNTEVNTSEFVDKQWLYVNDNNNGSYSSQIVLDTTPLSNSGMYVNWQESLILLPLVLQIESSAMNATDDYDHIAALKSGYWNMIHSLTCDFNNGNVIQQVPFLNVFCSFKNITSWSQNDLVNWSSLTGFYPDSAISWAYLDVAPASAGNPLQTGGTGLSNNRNAPYVSISLVAGTTAGNANIRAYNQLTSATLSSNDVRASWNEGMFQRQLNLSYDPTLPATSSFSSNKGALLSGANCSQIFRTFVTKASNLRWFAIDAVIRLKDIADFFNKCPMLKGSTMRIYLNTNQVYYTVGIVGGQYTAATGAQATYGGMSLTASPVVLGGGGTNPTMFASCDLGQGSNLLAPFNSAAGSVNTASVAVGLSVVRTQFTQLTNQNLSNPITSVRLYAPVYAMNPIAEQRFLSLTPTKRVVYNDIFQFSFPNQATNSPFNILVSNGIPNLRSVLVIGLLPRASNGTAAASGYIANSVISSTLLSPFCSTPATPDPIAITNFQIQISGKNLFNTQNQYDFESFMEQLVCSNQLNGGLTTSLSSGLVSKRDFQYLYRYYYGNCSRSLPSEEGVSKAVQILGTIVSPLATSVDLMVFCEAEREITIDTRTGARIA